MIKKLCLLMTALILLGIQPITASAGGDENGSVEEITQGLITKAETDSVMFTVIEADFMGSTVAISLFAEPRDEHAALVMEAAPKEDSSYTEAMKYGSDIWGLDCETYVENASQTWQSLGTDRSGAGLLAHIVVALKPDDLPETLNVSVQCKVFEPDNFNEAAESTLIPLSLPHATAQTISFDVDAKIGNYSLEHISAENTPAGLRVVMSGASENGEAPNLSSIKADGVVLRGGNGEMYIEEETEKCVIDSFYDSCKTLPKVLEIDMHNKMLVIDLTTETLNMK